MKDFKEEKIKLEQPVTSKESDEKNSSVSEIDKKEANNKIKDTKNIKEIRSHRVKLAITENDKGFFTIKLEETDPSGCFKIDFLFNPKKEIDDVPDNLIEFFDLCEDAYCIITAMPLKGISYKEIKDKKERKKEEARKEKQIRNEYIKALYGIAQVGLQGEGPQPKLAKNSLENLKEEILIKEGGRIKSHQFVDLGIKAFILGLISATLGYIFLQFSGLTGIFEYNDLYPYLFIFTGSMAGTWISFGVRNLKMTFRDLAVMEEDMLRSFPRLFFVGIVSIILMLFLRSDILPFDIGGIITSDIMKLDRVDVHILVGVIAGLFGNSLATGIYGKAKDMIKFDNVA